MPSTVKSKKKKKNDRDILRLLLAYNFASSHILFSRQRDQQVFVSAGYRDHYATAVPGLGNNPFQSKTLSHRKHPGGIDGDGITRIIHALWWIYLATGSLHYYIVVKIQGVHAHL